MPPASIPTALHRRGARSPLAYLRSLIGPDGQIAYARGVQQTPVWVTGEALMALAGKPLPLRRPAAARTRRPPATTVDGDDARGGVRSAAPRPRAPGGVDARHTTRPRRGSATRATRQRAAGQEHRNAERHVRRRRWAF